MSTMSKLLVGTMFLMLGLAIVAANAGARGEFDVPSQATLDAEQKRNDQAIEAIQQGRGRALNDGADHWLMIWWNCEMRFVREHRTPMEVESPGSPGGKTIVHVIDSPKETFDAQLPPQDARCLEVQPTQEQLDAGMAEMNARNAKAQGLPADWEPPVDIELAPTGPAS